MFEWGLMFFVMGLAGTLGLLVGTFLGGIPFVYSLPYLCWFYWNAGTKDYQRIYHGIGRLYASYGIRLSTPPRSTALGLPESHTTSQIFKAMSRVHPGSFFRKARTTPLVTLLGSGG